MKRFLIFLWLVLSWSLGAAQPIQRNYYTTNASPALPVWTNDTGVIYPLIFASNTNQFSFSGDNTFISFQMQKQLSDFSDGSFFSVTCTPTNGANLSLSGEVKNYVLLAPWTADSANAVSHTLSSAVPLTTAGALIMAVQNQGTNRFTVNPSGAVTISGNTNQYTDDGTQLLRNQVPIPTSTSAITLQNKTIQSTADGGNNTIKLKNYIVLAFPHSCDGAGAVISTNDNTLAYTGQALFAGGGAASTNYVEYRLTVPEDIDTSVALKMERFKFRLTATDTNAQSYVLTMASVADSASYDSPTLGQAVTLSFAGDASGASGDVETISSVTLTNWAANVTAGRLWVIRLARNGDTDASTQNSYSGPLVISYGSTQ